MWMFCCCGFFSIVNGKKPGTMVIRARKREHLRSLLKRYKREELRNIIASPKADYRYRVVVKRAVALSLISLVAEDIDYSNFKNAVELARPHDRDYLEVLHYIWWVARDLQKQKKDKGGEK